MTRTIPSSIRSQLVRLMMVGWQPKAIARAMHCSERTVYEIKFNLLAYGSPFKPHYRPMGAPSKITAAAGDGLIEYITWQPWVNQREMGWHLWEEWGIHCHQSTISRLIKIRRWSRKKGQRIGNTQSAELRLGWKAQILYLTAEQLIFVDETLFNETTGWRHHTYAPTGHPARYQAPR